MTAVEGSASLHESTVKAAEKHEGAFSVPQRRSAGSRSSRVSRATVDPRVMVAAKKLARGDLSRLRIIDATTVVVENPRT